MDSVSPTFVSAVLEAIGELSSVGGYAIKPYLNELFPMLLQCVKDQSSTSKRKVSIVTLIQIIQNTGFVIKPYFHYPEIITIVRQMIQNETNPSIRRRILKLIGSLGALDTYLVK